MLDIYHLIRAYRTDAEETPAKKAPAKKASAKAATTKKGHGEDCGKGRTGQTRRKDCQKGGDRGGSGNKNPQDNEKDNKIIKQLQPGRTM